MAEISQDQLRYERKFLVEGLTVHQVELLVRRHPMLFQRPYPKRIVNNIYLDTYDLEMYQDNVIGVTNRKKYRIRWYGDLFGQIQQPRLEIKIKEGPVGYKETYPLTPVRFEAGFGKEQYLVCIKNSELPKPLSTYLSSLEPTLVNRYARSYYANQGSRFRLTVDHQLSYYHINNHKNRFRYQKKMQQNVILELKYAADLDPQAQRLSAFFPFPVTKSSKYVMGIDHVYH